MPDNTFDVVSKIELPEVSNAIQQAMKEITTRFDLKDSHSQIELNEKDNKILLASKDEFKLKAINEIFQQKLVKRKVPLKGLVYGAVIAAAGSTVKQQITGFGRAEKGQVQQMVASLLRLPGPIASEDASDALAIAICHATHATFPVGKVLA